MTLVIYMYIAILPAFRATATAAGGGGGGGGSVYSDDYDPFDMW